MAHRIRYLILVPFVSALLMMAAIAEAPAGDAPVLIKGKFQTPVTKNGVISDWKARGYSDWNLYWKEMGWSNDRSYSHNCLLTVVVGRMEHIIDGERFVLEPGDELFYPANAKHTARNLYDGISEMLIATKP